MTSSVVSVPRSVDEIDAAWVRAALQTSGLAGDGRVTHADVTVIGEAYGFTGVVARVELTWADAPAAPRSVVVKLPLAKRGTQTSYRQRTDGNAGQAAAAARRAALEVAFYRSPVSRVAPAPRLWWSAVDESSGAVGLVLEDVRPAVQGDVLVGMAPSTVEKVLESIARLHAEPIDPDPASSPFPHWAGDDDARTDRIATAVGPFLDRHRSRLSVRVARLVERLPERLAEALAGLAAETQTVVHGDLHADNILIRPGRGPDRVVVVDWQTVALGPVGVDLSLLLAGSMTVGDRRAAEPDLLARYRRMLAAEDGPRLTEDAIEASYGRACAWQAAGTVAWLASADPAGLSARERALLDQVVVEGRAFEAAIDHGW